MIVVDLGQCRDNILEDATLNIIDQAASATDYFIYDVNIYFLPEEREGLLVHLKGDTRTADIRSSRARSTAQPHWQRLREWAS